MVHRSIQGRFSYANVASSLAVFIALGGTSYALTLPGNSVGAKQLRRSSVGSSELRTGAVRSADIRNGAITPRDLGKRAARQLRGRTGPAGPPGAPGVSYFLLADSSGGRVSGNGGVVGRPGAGQYVVSFPRSVAGCALVASPARVPGAAVEDPPPGSSVIVSNDGDHAFIRTFDENRQPTGLPFAVIAAC